MISFAVNDYSYVYVSGLMVLLYLHELCNRMPGLCMHLIICALAACHFISLPILVIFQTDSQLAVVTQPSFDHLGVQLRL